VNTVKTDIV